MTSFREMTAYIVVALVGLLTIFSALLFSTGDLKNLIISVGSSILASVVVSFLFVVFIGNPFSDLNKRLQNDIDVLRLSSQAGLIGIWASRSLVPMSMWIDLLRSAKREILIVASAMQFLSERPDFIRILNQKSKEGCRIIVLLQDPDSPHLERRSEEEGDAGSIRSRVETTIGRITPILKGSQSDLLFFDNVLYCSIFSFDDHMLVTPHMYGLVGASAPTLLLHSGDETLFDRYRSQFFALHKVSYRR